MKGFKDKWTIPPRDLPDEAAREVGAPEVAAGPEAAPEEVRAQQEESAQMQTLADREANLEKREQDVEAREANLEKREQDVEAREANLTEREQDVKDREANLTEREQDVKARETNLTERERNAEQGFLTEQRKAAEHSRKELERLQGDIQAAEKELEGLQEGIRAAEEKLSDKKRELQEGLVESRHRAMQKQDQELDRRNQELSREIEARRSALNEELRGRRVALEQAEQALEKQASDLDARVAAQQEQEKLLQAEKAALEAFKKGWKEQTEAECRELYEDRLHFYKESVNQMDQALRAQEAELSQLRRLDLDCGGKTREELQADLVELRKQLEAAKKRPPRELSEGEKEQLRKGQLYDSLEQKKQALEAENMELKKRLLASEMTRSEVNMAKSRCERMEIECNAMEQQLDLCQKKIRRLETDYQGSKEDAAARIADITRVAVLEPRAAEEDNQLTERKWLERTRQRCEKSGFQVSSRLLYSFHTALKTAEWSPITVLAGVSGTGKSMLPKLYARFGGLYFLSLPVQPDWDSSQSLFGFFNAIDNRFSPTNLLTAMVQMQDKAQKDISDKMLLVLLDEMNLAHVELYFSELLSKLEERRGEAEDAVSIGIDLGSGLPKYPVNLTRNVLWVGTMNEDETTKTLSDKVIDRSSMLTFPRPSVFARREKPELAPESKLLPRDQWNLWLGSKCSFGDEDVGELKASTEAINGHLAVAGRALGHRVWQSIEQYIANHPCVIEAWGGTDGNARKRAMQLAFEEALVQKVMPKLRGIELTGSVRSECLDPIQSELETNAPGLVADYQRAISGDADLFLWRSSQYLEASYD